jgi:ABC-type Fe3+ transport system permease subunit
MVAVSASVLKYTRPGRRLREAGVPTWVLALAAAAGVVGFFVIPVVGAVIGFVLALYLFERARAGSEQAWPSTKAALTAIAQSIGIELAGGFLILIVFLLGVFLT